MLTCITCSKQLNGGSLQDQIRQDEDDKNQSLTTLIKEMAIKASGAYKNCKPCSGGRIENQNFADSDLGYRRARSFNSTPRVWGKHLDGRMKKGLTSEEGTPVSLSRRSESTIFMEEDQPKEWVAQVEPGVLITLVSMPQCGNDLKRIRFSRELFDKWQAQRWWAENYEKVIELYNVQMFSEHTMPAPPHSEDESSKIGSAEGSSPTTPPLKTESLPRNFVCPKGMMGSPLKTDTSLADVSVRSSSSREADQSSEFSVSNASDVENEWVEEDQPGVYITIRLMPDGIRELRRVRFSREKFGETDARLWWEENNARIQEQYL